MTRHAQIPDPRFWFGKFPPEWVEIARAICPQCNQPIGYNRPAKQISGGWEHSPCTYEREKLWQLEEEAARLEAELAIRSSKYDAIDLNRKPEARRLERLMMKARRRLWRRKKNTENFTNGR